MATSLMQMLNKYQKPIFLVFVVVVVLGGLYLIATMEQTKDTFTNRNKKNGGKSSADAVNHFSTTEPTTDKLNGLNWDDSAIFVFHKMDGCGHCVNFAPTWKKVATAVNNGKLTRPDNKDIVMVIVDTEHPLSENVSGYPTIRKYMSNSPSDNIEFRGRTMDAAKSEANLVEFVTNS